MEYYSAIKNNIFEPSMQKWMHVETTMLSEINQTEAKIPQGSLIRDAHRIKSKMRQMIENGW